MKPIFIAFSLVFLSSCGGGNIRSGGSSSGGSLGMIQQRCQSAATTVGGAALLKINPLTAVLAHEIIGTWCKSISASDAKRIKENVENNQADSWTGGKNNNIQFKNKPTPSKPGCSDVTILQNSPFAASSTINVCNSDIIK